MNYELFFIPILTEAFNSSDANAALENAFKNILNKSEITRYQDGYKQFLHFMESARMACEYDHGNIDNIAGMIMERYRYPETIKLKIECNGKTVHRLVLKGDYDQQTAEMIMPGDYILKVNNIIIWQGNLDSKYLSWSKAYNNKPLKAAADTKVSRQQPSRQIHLLDNTMTIDIYPGPAYGSLIITINNFWDDIK